MPDATEDYGVPSALDFPDCQPCQAWEDAGAWWPRPCINHWEGEPPTRPCPVCGEHGDPRRMVYRRFDRPHRHYHRVHEGCDPSETVCTSHREADRTDETAALLLARAGRTARG